MEKKNLMIIWARLSHKESAKGSCRMKLVKLLGSYLRENPDEVQ